MASYLETIPRDILQHIAFLLVASSVLELPQSLLYLLLTSSTIYDSLTVRNCPHLYAKIFRTKFDIAAKLHDQLTDSALAAELLIRFRILKCAHRRDLSSARSRTDLWAALRMVLENNGLNDAQLLASGFSEFIMSFARTRLSCDSAVLSRGPERETNALAIWLLCFTLSHQDIAGTSSETQEDILKLLRPFTASTGGNTIDLAVAGSYPTLQEPVDADGEPDIFQPRMPRCPEPSSAAIIITFALKEALVLGVPPHVPETRAIAIATQRSGPTMEDFQAITACKTPLLADTRRTISLEPAPSTVRHPYRNFHDLEFCQLLHDNYHLSSASAFPYAPGTLTGLWDGTFMISGLAEPKTDNRMLPAIGDFTCRKPMQCAISEFLCFSPHLPLPLDDPFDVTSNSVLPAASEDNFEANPSKFGYEKYSPTPDDGLCVQRDPSQALDILIMGETLHDHEQAWGAYRFTGRVHPDGLIKIKREPKNADEANLGTWIFEGRLRYGLALVGQLRSSIPTELCDIRGIFSLHKTAETWGE